MPKHEHSIVVAARLFRSELNALQQIFGTLSERTQDLYGIFVLAKLVKTSPDTRTISNPGRKTGKRVYISGFAII